MTLSLPEEQIRLLVDKQEIHEVLARYCRAIDRCDAELLESVYHPDAVDEHGTVCARGFAEIAKHLERTRASCSACMHAISNELIDVRGDVAFSECYFISSLVIEKEGKEYTRLFCGRFVDRLERRAGVWKISHRIVVHEWDRIDPVDQYHFPRPLKHARGLRSREDASYRIASLEGTYSC